MKTNHYDTLNVSKTATTEEIKNSYRKLAKKHHPDRGGDASRFRAIQEAYDILSNENKRLIYDNELNRSQRPFGFDDFIRNNQYNTYRGGYSSNNKAEEEFRRAAEDFDYAEAHYNQYDDDWSKDDDDPFEDLFKEGSFWNTWKDKFNKKYNRPKQFIKNISVKLKLDYNDFFKPDLEKKLRITRKLECECQGIKPNCSSCNGIGYIESTKEINLSIPYYKYIGSTIIYENLGNVSLNGVGYLELTLLLDYDSLPRDIIYDVEENYVLQTVPVSFREALKGGKVRITLLNQQLVDITLEPANLFYNNKLKMSNRGLPINANETESGYDVVFNDMHIIFDIQKPTPMDYIQIEKLV